MNKIMMSITVSKKVNGVYFTHENGVVEIYKNNRKVVELHTKNLRELLKIMNPLLARFALIQEIEKYIAALKRGKGKPKVLDVQREAQLQVLEDFILPLLHRIKQHHE